VSDVLEPVKKVLHTYGYRVVNLENDSELSEKDLHDYDFVVTTGMDKNFLEMQEASGKATVINASGLTPEEVAREIERRK